MTIVMKAEGRIGKKKSELRLMRQEGKIPGVVYGKGLDGAVNISVDEKELNALMRSNPNAVIQLDVPESGKHAVMVAELQRHTLSGMPLNVDFHRINMNEEVRANVPIHAEGQSNGLREGGILQIILHELEVQCLPGAIPESIHADMSQLELGDSLLVKDLQLPAGVEAKSEPESVVLTILAPQKELSEEEKDAQDVELAEAKERSTEANHEEIATSK
ncbi:50S ribosomal protein L25 [Paenibacillus sp. J5C_2022]|uniref:50S ribosomal protein L25 n=1 Tax=Paenibacillus sp. J5C2022 TaxID=2977129 RepID=UPI0021CE5786|nr:50S ribosomal protein L25 [Paenibacillus sp. J5C2022]MCU6710855.1 50S ribosomal protein L25 [Paenibacillus sp. J5C2022]